MEKQEEQDKSHVLLHLLFINSYTIFYVIGTVLMALYY